MTQMAPLPAFDTLRISVIGLGYVGLPLAIELAKVRPTIGFDVKEDRIEALQCGVDATREVTAEALKAADGLMLTSDTAALGEANFFVVTVPTPIDASKRPDLTPLLSASDTVGRMLKPGDIVVYESTVFPGATEEVCVPVLETVSGLRHNVDFYTGYSPERINPGDKTHRLPDIRKVTSGSTAEVADLVDDVYARIITAGTYKAQSMRVAEAAKVIENTQRDINIALVNELAIIFNRLGLDTDAVLEAAGTKWNFLPFRPGLVGGHCIGVDPYYLTHKAEASGYHPEIILAGRRLNDSMGSYVAGQLVKAMLRKRVQIHGARVLILGLTFKENCPDLRNTRVVDIIEELEDFGVAVDVHDPLVVAAEARETYGLELLENPEAGSYDGIILAVSHAQFRDAGAAWCRSLGRDAHVFYDLKSVFARDAADLRL